MKLSKSAIYKLLFINKFSLLTLLLIVTHQLLIATSVIFLTQLIQGYQSQANLKSNLLMYLFCMIFPYIPAFISFISLQKWINASHYNFINLVTSSKIFHPNQLNNLQLKDKVDSILSTNSFMTIGSYLYFIHDLLSLILNSVFSMLVIGFLLPKELAAGYVISTVLSFIIIFLSQKKVRALGMKTEADFINYSAILSKVWQNFSLNNKANITHWTKAYEDLSDKYYSSSILLQMIKQGLNTTLAFVALLPTSYLIYQIMINQMTQPAILTAIIVNLTRIFTILSSLNSLLHAFVELPSLNARLGMLFSIGEIKPKEIDFCLKHKLIKLNDMDIQSYDQVISTLKNHNNGRYTLSGENGSGKSTLLCYIKEAFKDDAVLMPANNVNMLWGFDTSNLSTGLQSIHILEQIEQMHEPILLLDEWDANLDKNNTALVDRLLTKISQTKIVVEVRH